MTETTEPKAKPWFTKPRNIAIIFVCIVFLVLILQNMESVMVQILFWKASAPAALIYVIFALAGFGAARITLRPRSKKSETKST
jgi:uncharacterized integral membrane protein